MLGLFQIFVEKEKLFTKKEKILLAVSGGLDSVVMCHLFYQAGYKFGIAHCNFKLRGKEADGDEIFVKELAKRYDAPFYSKQFKTTDFSEEKGVSIQMGARELRYTWFEELCEEKRYTYSATAHHRDDVVETILINLLRGTGISGLHGIREKNGKIIRPLLFTDKKTIEEFAKKHKLKFREDSSNSSNKYIRNKLRNEVIPVLKEINPNLNSSFFETGKRVKEVEEIYLSAVESQKNSLLKLKDDSVFINIKELKKLVSIKTYLYEFLKKFNFNVDTIQDIVGSLDAFPGKIFYSPTHCLLKDREVLVIKNNQKPKAQTQYLVSSGISQISEPINIKFETKQQSAKFKIPPASSVACLDMNKLKFPLQLRKWEAGDSFYPLGMKQSKKLSDFFIDQKISRFDKEKAWVLTSSGKIIWILGYRIDDRFKVTQQTKNIFICKM